MIQTSDLLEQVLSDENMKKALHHVISKNSCPGADNLHAKDLPYFWSENGEKIKMLLRKGSYMPVPARRIRIKKENGKKREISIPSVVDRMIQNAFLYKLQDIYEPSFHSNSFGFRKKRSTISALTKCLNYINRGYTCIINIDIKSFFDTVNHKKLLSILEKQITDTAALRIIKKYIRSDILDGHVSHKVHQGIIQGSVLSPLLANIFLNELDWFMDKEKILFIRYADDIVVLLKNESSSVTVWEKIHQYISNTLLLNINTEKTTIVTADNLHYLGFSFTKNSSNIYCLSVPDKTQERLLSKINKLSTLSKTNKLEYWNKLGCIHRGWINYYKHINSETMVSILSQIEDSELQKIHTLSCNNESPDNFLTYILEANNFVSLTQWYYFLTTLDEGDPNYAWNTT